MIHNDTINFTEANLKHPSPGPGAAPRTAWPHFGLAPWRPGARGKVTPAHRRSSQAANPRPAKGLLGVFLGLDFFDEIDGESKRNYQKSQQSYRKRMKTWFV